jgi:hypothetical protein
MGEDAKKGRTILSFESIVRYNVNMRVYMEVYGEK